MSKDDDTKFTTPPVVFVLEEQIRDLKKQVEGLQEKNKLLWQQNCEIGGNFWDKVQENKKLKGALARIKDNGDIERADAFKFITIATKALEEIKKT
jgi:hypothetical protein